MKLLDAAQNLTVVKNTIIIPSINQQFSEILPVNDCNGHKHGDHIENKRDPTTFFRCVWNRLILMSCPAGTVFNSYIDVCDYASAVKAKRS